MKNLTLITLFIFVILSSCTRDYVGNEDDNKNQENPLTGKEINKIIDNAISETGTFDWLNVDNHVLWSAALNGDSIISIGYGQSSYSKTKSTELIAQKSDILELLDNIEGKEQRLKSTENEIIVHDDNTLNYIDVKISKLKTIQELKIKFPDIRYIEPTGYNYYQYQSRLKSEPGCTTDDSPNMNTADYTWVQPNCLVSWTFYKHNIPQAWTYSTGSGVGVGLIDTGVSDYQNLLGSDFNDGYSNGRTINKYGVFVDSWKPWKKKTDGYHDKCGHGTLMAATIAGPRNNDRLPIGVAYNCNLVSYRATKNVVVDGYHEKKGVARALVELGNRSDVKVISMSIGHIFSIGVIKDAVKYAYARGKMIIAAGGTSTQYTNFFGVIFPASMDETVAVTGITDGSGYEQCAICHKGKKIDFTVIMQRDGDKNRTSATLGYRSGQKDYVGGSSVSTAMTAGIAALIWSRHPSWTRSQVLDKMIKSASLYPNKSNKFGYGCIDALAAVQ